MKQTAITVDGLGKRYQIEAQKSHDTLRDSLVDKLCTPFRNLFRGEPVNNYKGKGADFWALRDVSFEVKQGEVLGIIGPNGAGKSTLLKILSRITEPTEGMIDVYGRVGSLLEVGTGFHPELNGRENIYLYGAVLGMRRSEIDQKFDEIVAFSGVEQFIDTPVKRYSSGMYVRLAFAVSAHLDPEILIVDEVLAVGDVAFQQKCLGKMNDIAGSGRTVLFVSHNLSVVRNLCTRALYINRGYVRFDGRPEETISKYLTSTIVTREAAGVQFFEGGERAGSGNVRAVSFEARDPILDGPPRSGFGAEFVVEYTARDEDPISMLHLGVTVMDMYGSQVFGCTTRMMGQDFRDVAPKGRVVCRMENMPLNPGRYLADIIVKDMHGLADRVEKVMFSIVFSGEDKLSAMPSERLWNVFVYHTWDWQPAGACDG